MQYEESNGGVMEEGDDQDDDYEGPAFDAGSMSRDVPAIVETLQDTIALLGLQENRLSDNYIHGGLDWLIKGESGRARIGGLQLDGGRYEGAPGPMLLIPMTPLDVAFRLEVLHICTGCINPLNAYLWSWQNVFRRVVLVAEEVAVEAEGAVMITKGWDDPSPVDEVEWFTFDNEEETLEELATFEVTGLEVSTEDGFIPAMVVMDLFDASRKFLGQWWMVNTRHLTDAKEARRALERANRKTAKSVRRGEVAVSWRRVCVDDWKESWRLKDESGAVIELRNHTQQSGENHGAAHDHSVLE